MDERDVIRRVRKLLQITVERGATRQEAESAAARARELLARYELTVDMVEEEGDSPFVQDISVDQTQEVWARALATSVALLHSCQFLWEQSGICEYKNYVIGRPDRVIMTKNMNSYLRETVKRMAARAKLGYESDEQYEHSYTVGCVKRLCERIEKLRFGDGGTLPVPFDNIDDWLKDQDIDVSTKTEVESNLSTVGYFQGFTAAESISLSTQIPEQTDTHKIEAEHVHKNS